MSNPALVYNFAVSLVASSTVLDAVIGLIQPSPAAGFSECSGLESTLEAEEYKEGGNNGAPLRFPTRTTWANIRLRRGVALSPDLWQWHADFAAGVGARRDGVITLQDNLHRPVCVWSFIRGLPVKWVGPQLNATQSQVAIEELEIAHEGMSMLFIGAQ